MRTQVTNSKKAGEDRDPDFEKLEQILPPPIGSSFLIHNKCEILFLIFLKSLNACQETKCVNRKKLD